MITGRASSPKYLRIDNEKIELKDASDLLGKTTWETTDILQKRHGKQISVADELLTHGPYSEWNGPPLWSLDRYPHGGARA